METKTVKTTSLDELGTKINELLQDDWFVNTDFLTNTIYGYKPIPERKQPVAPVAEHNEKQAEKTVKELTQADEIVENATKITELEKMNQQRLQNEFESAEGELQQANSENDPAKVEAATAKVSSAKMHLETNKGDLRIAIEYQNKADENKKAVGKEKIKSDIERSFEPENPGEPERSVSEPSPTTFSRSV